MASTTMAAKPTPQQQNDINRQLVLQTSNRNNLPIGNFGPFQPGGRMSQQLTNVGILTGIVLHVVVSLDITTAATPSRKAPWNILSNIKFKDYQQVDRVDCDGFALHVHNMLKTRVMEGYANNVSPALPFSYPISTIGSIPTAVGNNQTIEFLIYVPAAYVPEMDLSGALLMQAINGTAFINTTFNDTFFGADDSAVYSAGAGSVNSITVSVDQQYLAFTTPNLPQIDLSTVYELNGGLTLNSGIAVGQKVPFNYPNLRRVLSLLVRYENGGMLGYGNLSKLELKLNANQTLEDLSEARLRFKTLRHLGFDLPPGNYYISNRALPIDTVIYGNVQALVTPSNYTNPSTMTALFESFYLSGAPLGGITG